MPSTDSTSSDHSRDCIYCSHCGDYCPMYVGDDPRKWGTFRCKKKKRRVFDCAGWKCRSFDPSPYDDNPFYKKGGRSCGGQTHGSPRES